MEWFKEYFGFYYVILDNTNAFGFNNLEERTKYDVDQILRLGEIKKGKILDISCGYGRQSIELAKRLELEIYGLDLSSALIDIALYRRSKKLDVNEEPIKLKGNVKFIVGDMRNFSKIVNGFDLVYNWFWSFGYFNREENIKSLKEFYKALKKDGILLMHTIPKEHIPKYLKENKRTILPSTIRGKKYSGGMLDFQKNFDKEKNILYTKLIAYLRDGIVIPKKPVEGSIIIYSIAEYKKMLQKVGFHKIEVHDSYFPFKIFKGVK